MFYMCGYIMLRSSLLYLLVIGINIPGITCTSCNFIIGCRFAHLLVGIKEYLIHRECLHKQLVRTSCSCHHVNL